MVGIYNAAAVGLLHKTGMNDTTDSKTSALATMSRGGSVRGLTDNEWVATQKKVFTRRANLYLEQAHHAKVEKDEALEEAIADGI
ncbi:hypothetical protein SARC_14619, partial [Sphaeroforma arctica JP610]